MTGQEEPAAPLGRRRIRTFAAALSAALVSLALLPAPAGATNDEYYGGQWALSQISAPQAWTRSTGAGVVIGIVDTGIDTSHPDLAGKVLATANCVGRRPCAVGAGQDDNEHGTIVSGIAAAATGNGIGVAGAAPDAKLVVAKALDARGVGSVEDIKAGIEWVVSQGARVVNLSLGDDVNLVNTLLGSPLQRAIEFAWSRGAVPVLASGNFNACGANLGSQNYGGLDALVVGATERSGSVACYSSSPGTAKWGLVAPGGAASGGLTENVYSTGLGGRYVSAAGTSMAAPHVSAAVALLLAQGLSPLSAVDRLMATLDRVGCGVGCKGRLNMAAAVGADLSTPVATAAPPRPRTPPSTRAPERATTTSSSTTTTVAPAPEPAPVEVVAPPARLVVGPPRVLGGGPVEQRSPLAVTTATVLLAVVGAAVARVAGRRGLGPRSALRAGAAP